MSNCWCHLCNRLAEEEFYIDHLNIHHPMTLFVLYATHMPLAHMTYVDTFPFYLNCILRDSDEVLQLDAALGAEINDNSEYEQLLALCDEIGYHKIGIDDLTTVSSVCDPSTLNSDDICPICIECFIDNDNDDVIYTLNTCKHSYCKTCIETWCIENKSCPVCKVDIV